MNTNVTFKWFTTDIAWSSDSERYRRSNLLNTDFDPAKVIPPPLWRKLDKYKNGYTKDNFPDISKMERFQVWMRTAGLPTFRKLWGRNAESKLPTGDWQIDIAYQFDPANYSGTKSIVISTVSVLGGKNNFLGIAYISVGVICWVLGLGLLLRHMIKPR